jgi:hypothetical protein
MADTARNSDGGPPPLPPPTSSKNDTPVPGSGSLPPPLPPATRKPSWSGREILATLLSLCLGLFLADAIVSLLDDSLILFFDVHILTAVRGLVFLFAILAAILIYVLMGITPMIPKRLFLPVTLFAPVAGLITLLFMIYFFHRIQQFAWAVSFYQVALGLIILRKVQGGFKVHWPLFPESRLLPRGFSWRNLVGFLAINLFVLLPVVIGYLFFCSALAVNHLSDGFLALRSHGLTVQIRKYVRADGKTIQLIPMAHIGEPDFYRKLSQSFPTNAVILMEGVSDDRNLLTNKISYKRMATSLGLAEQQKEFKPSRTQMARADVDVEVFTTNTIDFINLVMLVHAQGLNSENLAKMMRYSPRPQFEQELFGDLLGKRNRHLLQEIDTQLKQADNIIVPWGAAHMPEIAKGIQSSDFRLSETREETVIRFGKEKK